MSKDTKALIHDVWGHLASASNATQELIDSAGDDWPSSWRGLDIAIDDALSAVVKAHADCEREEYEATAQREDA